MMKLGMIVKKQEFQIPAFTFKNVNKTIPIKFGYEMYGKLNEDKSNAILICHYFTGTSHAAGKYDATEMAPGWWDTLIGPGKAIDTDKYCVISCDTISNINHHNKNVITTGPASIDPETGKPYAMDFPIFTLDDVVKMQKMLIDSLGIKFLNQVIGPSMGGLQAFMWAKHFPEMVKGVISVVATPMVRPSCLMVPNQLGIEAIRLDSKWKNGNYYESEPPTDGLLLAFKILLTETRTDLWANRNYGRRLLDPEFKTNPDPYKSFEGRYLVEQEIENQVVARMQFFDANAYIYIAKSNALFDLCEKGETLEQALSKLKMPVKMIIDDSDLMFTREQAEEAMQYLPNSEAFYYNSENGHLSCLFDTHYFTEILKKYVS
jgi:homoserine O-acetyltransferase